MQCDKGWRYLAIAHGSLAESDVPELDMAACILRENVPPVQQARTANKWGYALNGRNWLLLLRLWECCTCTSAPVQLKKPSLEH